MRLKKWIYTAAALLWMILIFSFSAKPADQSAEMSLSVGRLAGKLFVKEYQSWSQEEQKAFAERIDYPVRKTAHAAEYMVLGVLLLCALKSYNLRCLQNKKVYAAAFILGSAYAASDEFHQFFVPGRSCQLSDVLLDSTGVLIGVLVFFLIFNRKP